jgi:hypothetical protein
VAAPPFRDDLAAALELEQRLTAEKTELENRCRLVEHAPRSRETPLWYFIILITCALVIGTTIYRGKKVYYMQVHAG